jgi:hypothetical protein
MNLNSEQFPTYKSLFPVQTTQTTAIGAVLQLLGQLGELADRLFGR